MSFDFKLSLSVSSTRNSRKGVLATADDWLDQTVNRIQQHKEDRKQTQDYEWNSIEITGPREVSLDIKHDSDKHELDLSLYVASSHPQIDDLVKIDLNESEEVCFKWQGSCIGAINLAHALLDLVIDNSLLRS